MDVKAFLHTMGCAKQMQIGMVLARGLWVPEAERALLVASPQAVCEHYMRVALARGCSVLRAMSAVYERRAPAPAPPSALASALASAPTPTPHTAPEAERLHVVFIGVRCDDSGRIKAVPVDALRTAIQSIMAQEGAPFTAAAEVSRKRRRYGALHNALSTHAASVAHDAAAATAQAHAQAKARTSATANGHGSVRAREQERKSPNITALLIVPAALSPDAAKEAAKVREWVSTRELKNLLLPLDVHEGVREHVFLRGADAQAALQALGGTQLQHLPVLKREDAVAEYCGARVGDVCRVDRGQGVAHWTAVR